MILRPFEYVESKTVDDAVAALEAAGVECKVSKTTAAAYGRPAPRPAYSVLVTERDDAPRLPAWQDGLAAHLSASRALT